MFILYFQDGHTAGRTVHQSTAMAFLLENEGGTVVVTTPLFTDNVRITDWRELHDGAAVANFTRRMEARS